MGFIFGLIKGVIKWTLYFLVFAAIIVLIPNLPPYTQFSSIELEPPLAREGPLAPNGALNNPEKLYNDKVLGPEAFQLFNGEVYTSLATGEIVKVSPGGHVTFVTKIGQPCTGLSKEEICGRPLGFDIDEKNRQLYVADAYYGIWKVDLKTDSKKLLVSPRVEINGRLPKLFNSIVLSKNGDFYWTESSSDFHLKDGAFSVLTDPTGRLFHYNAAKNQSRVLLDNLWFANGVVMSPDNQFLLIAETSRFRVVKYYIDGPKKGQSEVFVAGLPGTPDNLRALPDGSGVVVALYTVYDEEHPLLIRSLTQTPIARKFLARIQRLVEIPFEFLNSQYPNAVFEDIVYSIGSFKSMSAFLPSLSGLVQLDWNGNIVASYYNTDGTLPSVSDCIVFNDKLYLGAPHGQSFIGAVPAPPLLKKAFSKSTPKAETVKRDAPKAEAPKVAKPVQQPPKTTTPPPKTTTPPPKTTTPPPKTTTPPPKTTTPPPKTTTPPPKTTTPPPKTTQPPKPAETVKVSTPKPAPAKPADPKPVPTPKPTTPPKQAETKPVESKTTTPKPKTEKPAAKPSPTPETKKAEPQKPIKKPTPEQIPIVEEIPSDTIKPNNEKLKVIKKGGPTEIPNPAL